MSIDDCYTCKSVGVSIEDCYAFNSTCVSFPLTVVLHVIEQACLLETVMHAKK